LLLPFDDEMVRGLVPREVGEMVGDESLDARLIGTQELANPMHPFIKGFRRAFVSLCSVELH
jgi:hypothetical protein